LRERRQFTRVPAVVEAQWDGCDDAARVMVEELSLGGALIACEEDAPVPGPEAVLRMGGDPESEVEVKTHVVRVGEVDGHRSMAVRFIDPRPEVRVRLANQVLRQHQRLRRP